MGLGPQSLRVRLAPTRVRGRPACCRPTTNDIHIRSRNTQRSRQYFPRPLLGSGPIPLGRGAKFVLRQVLGHRLGRGPAAARMSRPSGTSKRVRACCQRWSGQATKKDLALSLPCWVTALVRDRIVVMTGLSWSRTRSWPQRWSMSYRGDGSVTIRIDRLKAGDEAAAGLLCDRYLGLGPRWR